MPLSCHSGMPYVKSSWHPSAVMIMLPCETPEKGKEKSTTCQAKTEWFHGNIYWITAETIFCSKQSHVWLHSFCFSTWLIPELRQISHCRINYAKQTLILQAEFILPFRFFKCEMHRVVYKQHQIQNQGCPQELKYLPRYKNTTAQ